MLEAKAFWSSTQRQILEAKASRSSRGSLRGQSWKPRPSLGEAWRKNIGSQGFQEFQGKPQGIILEARAFRSSTQGKYWKLRPPGIPREPLGDNFGSQGLQESQRKPKEANFGSQASRRLGETSWGTTHAYLFRFIMFTYIYIYILYILICIMCYIYTLTPDIFVIVMCIMCIMVVCHRCIHLLPS